MTAPFRFSEDHWKKISEPLQSHLGLTVQDDYSVPVRHLLEEAIDYWRLSNDERNENDCVKIWQAIKVLRDTKDSDVGGRIIDSRLLESLDALEQKCRYVLGLAEMARFKNNGRRDLLIKFLLAIWEDHGGKAKTSTASDGKTPSGPLIRFLLAVTYSLGIELSPHTARNMIRKHREVRKLDVV